MEESRKRLALRSDAPYFNAGVICFDWSATNASGLLQQARAFAEKSSHLCKSHDQDALNKAFEGAWAPLDPRWNFMTVAVPDDIFRLYYPERLQPYIAHFAGAMKPWTKGFPERFGRHRAWYCDLLRESPWPHFAAPAHASLTLFRSSTDRLKRWVSAKRKRFQAAFGHVSRAKDTVGQQRPSAVPRKSSLTEASRNGEANPELELLLDQMIAEAAGSERATRPGSK
jgi:lipopolysaccharide biosynthesis glycosyltransferase